MYFQHFGLRTDPFPLTPRLYFVFQSRTHGETMAHLVYGIEQEESIVLITGGIGTGKTLALHSLVTQLSNALEPIVVNVTQLSWPELIRFILYEMGAKPQPGLSLADLLQQLKQLLRERAEAGRRVLLIIDEAQHLDVESLEGLRLLLNLSSPDNPSLQMILAGQPALERTIARRDLAQLNQRIRVRYRLQPLTRAEVEDYLDHRTQMAGGTRGLFHRSALDRITSLSGGIPRVVNILASRAMLAAFVEKARQVEARHVRVEDLPPLSDTDDRADEASGSAATAAQEPAPPPTRSPAGGEPRVAPAPSGSASRPAPPPDQLPLGPQAPERRSRDGRRIAVAALLPVLTLLIALAVAWQLDLGSLRTRLTTEMAGLDAAGSRPEGAASVADRDLPAADAVGGVAGEEPAAPVTRMETGEEPSRSGESEAAVPAAPAAPAEARETPRQESATVAPSGQFLVHLASFRDADPAVAYVDLLTEAGATAFLETAEAADSTWVRVYIGPFPDAESARVRARDLSRNGLADYSLIVER